MNKYDDRVNELKNEHTFNLNGGAPIELSETDLQYIEQKLGHPLPSDFREFWRNYSGIALYGVTYGGPGNFEVFLEWHEMLDNYAHYRNRDVIPAELLPIAEDAGSNKICLAIAGDRIGAIYFWLLQGASVPPDYSNTDFIAPSFDEFMQSLRLENED